MIQRKANVSPQVRFYLSGRFVVSELEQRRTKGVTDLLYILFSQIPTLLLSLSLNSQLLLMGLGEDGERLSNFCDLNMEKN